VGKFERTGLQGALDRYADGGSVLILAKSPSGGAGELVAAIPDNVPIRGRVACAQMCRSEIGAVSHDLDLDSFAGGVLVIEDAQWADATSLGRIQRLLRSGEHPLLVIASHRPTEGVEGWWLDRLADAARMHAHLFTLEIEADEPSEQTQLTGNEADFVAATALLSGAVPVRILSKLTSSVEEETLRTGESLVSEGWVAEERGGYVPGPRYSESAIGPARVGLVASRLAPLMAADGASPAIVGNLLLASADFMGAFDTLHRAAVDAEENRAVGEAFNLAEGALRAAEGAEMVSDPRLGSLHLICGRFLRTAGRTDWAQDHLEKATSTLQGLERIEALRLGAMVADDAQRPQDAERIVAMAELESMTQGRPEELGQLLTLRARSLNRIGFAAEADVTLSKALDHLGADTDTAHHHAALVNRAWINFDRGESRLAESEFALLSDQARRDNKLALVADHEAWRSRALFSSGHPAEALRAISHVEELSLSEGVEAPLFLAYLARTEGGLAYGQYEDALGASEEVLDLVERQLPAWENMARSLRAQAYLRLGRLAEAQAEIERALDLTPSGANGWRWRTRCRAIAMEVEAAQEGRIGVDAEDLADLLLQSRLYGWAAELLCVIAEQGARVDSAKEAMAIALQIGQPMLAARCAHAGNLWADPEAAAAAIHLRQVEEELPPDWRDMWLLLPHVATGLEASVPETEPDLEAASRAMDQALARAGLSGDVILSPAQRRERGLVERGRPRWRPIQLVAAAVGVVVIAAGTAFAVSQAVDDPAPEAVIVDQTSPPSVPTTQPLTLEETGIEIDNGRGFLFGTATHRGDYGRSGYLDIAGPVDVQGHYWKTRTAGSIDATPVAFGQQLFVGTTEGTFYIFDQSTGDFRTIPANGGIPAAAALGVVDRGEERTPAIVVFVDDAGVVRMAPAGAAAVDPWTTEVGGRIESSPVVHEEAVYLANSEGYVFMLDAFSGDVVDRWPAEGEDGVGPIVADLAFSDDLLYIGSQDAKLYIIDVSGPEMEFVCEFDARAPIDVNPIVEGGVVYVPTRSRNMWMLPEGECSGSVPNRLSPYVAETPLDVAPAIVNGVLYLPDGPYLYARDLANQSTDLWMPGHVDADSIISSPPVVTNDTVYFASEDGVVHAVDSQTGDLRWQWRTGLTVRGAVAVVEDAVFIASNDGFVYAVGP
jgi:outer membrane protein assembly factor BamB/tetratricopeptide (TPR) repeat protein